MKEHETTAPYRVSPSHLVLLFLVALLPRVAGLITYGNPDEDWGSSVRILTGELSGGTSQTLPLINYLNAASFLVLYAIGRLVGVWHTTADFRAQYFSDRTPFVFTGSTHRRQSRCTLCPTRGPDRQSPWPGSEVVVAVGLMVAILPINIWSSHFSKPDSGVAFGVLLLVWSLLRKLEDPEARGSDVLVGVALAIVMSFKQTALFVVAPALVGFVALLRWDCKLPWSRIARGLLVGLLACVVAWVPMNIGILLDLPGFLEYQRATVVVMTRKGSAFQIVQYVIPILAGTITGLTAAGILAWLFAPFVRRDAKFLILWVSAAFAYVAFSAISGGLRTLPRYFLPYDELAFTLGCIAALSLAEREGRSRLVGAFLIVAVLAFEGLGSLEVVRQAMTTPMPARCSEVLKTIAQPDRDKILAADLYLVGVPINAAASDEAYRRQERLAKKYGVKLRERAEENKTHRQQTVRGYYVRGIPFAFGGMEDLEQEKAESAVKPYWWPIQEEEWDLDYWTVAGIQHLCRRRRSGAGGHRRSLRIGRSTSRSRSDVSRSRCYRVGANSSGRGRSQFIGSGTASSRENLGTSRVVS